MLSADFSSRRHEPHCLKESLWLLISIPGVLTSRLKQSLRAPLTELAPSQECSSKLWQPKAWGQGVVTKRGKGWKKKEGAHFNPAETPALLYKPLPQQHLRPVPVPQAVEALSACKLSGPTQPGKVLEDAGNLNK